MSRFRNYAYESSCDLAKEKGAFPWFEKEQYLANKFIKTLPNLIQEDIANYGIRNSILLCFPSSAHHHSLVRSPQKGQ